MLADRHYLQRQRQSVIWSVTTILVILNLCVFICQLVAERLGWDYLEFFALRADLLVQGHLWQLLTFQFLHDPDNIVHILLNCAFLWFFGRQVESFLGRASFLKLYLWSGVVGGMTQALVSWVFVGQDMPLMGVVGASAGVCGIIAAFAAIHWDQKLILWLFFCVPIPMRGKYVVLSLMVFCGLGWWLGSGNVAHAAHFGGIWMGLVYIRWIVQADRVLNAWEAVRSRIKSRPLIEPIEASPAPLASVNPDPNVELRRIPAEHESEPSVKIPDNLAPDEFIELLVDPILDKIAVHGIDCLTDHERKTLEKGRELVMGK